MTSRKISTISDTANNEVIAKKTYCRVCHASCPMEIDIQDNKPIAVRPDLDDPLYGGYTCLKGRQIVEQYNRPGRLKKSLKKMPDGSFIEIPLTQALDEIAGKVKEIIEQDGPRSIASYAGTFAFQAVPAAEMARAFHNGIKSPSYYSLVTIDQPAKAIAATRFGMWAGGFHGYDQSDVMMSVGGNSIVSHGAAPGGIAMYNPSRRYQDLIKRGCTVISVDPRVTEVARRAKYHLQIRPGEDSTLLCGMIRIILNEELHDKVFSDKYVDGLEELKAAVEDFTLDYVANRTGLDPALVLEATRVFAAGKIGSAVAGTGPDMSPHGNLVEHLLLVINAILGRHPQEGEPSAYPSLLSPEVTRKAQVIPANPLFGKGPYSRVRGLGEVFGEMPTSALPDEILMPGEGQVKALFSIGGNPMGAWPDQVRTQKALKMIPLLVSIDIKMQATCEMSDYVLPGKHCLEREDINILANKRGLYEYPYANYANTLFEADDELIDDWEFYWEIAKRIGSEIPLMGGNCPMDKRPSKLEVLGLVLPNSRISLAELRDHDGAKMYDDINDIVETGDPEAHAKFQTTPDGIIDEIREIRTEALTEDWRRVEDEGYAFRLTSRRLKDSHNTCGREFEAIRNKGTTNYAYMHPKDLEKLGIASEDIVMISGKHGEIPGVVKAAPDILQGVISMSHGWNDKLDLTSDVRLIGSSTTRLQASDQEYDPIHGMPRQSSIPVNVRPAKTAE